MAMANEGGVTVNGVAVPDASVGFTAATVIDVTDQTPVTEIDPTATVVDGAPVADASVGFTAASPDKSTDPAAPILDQSAVTVNGVTDNLPAGPIA